MKPYTPGEQPADTDTIIKLNTNENPYPVPDSVMHAVHAITAQQLVRYPDAVWKNLRHAAADNFSLNPENIFCGRGGDEVLALILDAFCNTNDKVVMPYPNYSLYEVLCSMRGIRYTLINTAPPDFDINLDALLSPKSKLIFFTNPNAPTGRFYPLLKLERFLKKYKGLFICDEAYIDFGGISAIPLLKDFPNLIIVKTLSKACSLAGLRLGFALAAPNLIEALMRIKDSYNLDWYQQALGCAAFKHMGVLNNNLQKIISSRIDMYEALKGLRFTIIPSKANFLFVRHPDIPGEKLYQRLKENNIYIRWWNKPLINDWIRITIGTPKQCTALITALESILK